MISDIAALKKWNAIPPDMRARIVDNVFCSVCGLTTISDYSVTMDRYGILLTGECAKCGQPVARFLEED